MGAGGRLRNVWTVVKGLRWYARVGGPEAPGRMPVVLVHGLSLSGRSLIPIARRLRVEYPVYIPDLPGFGRSAKPSRSLDVHELAEALLGWLDAFGLERVALVGGSLGCQVIVDLALRHPERVCRAALVGPSVDPRAPTVWQEVARGALDMLGEPLSFWPVLMCDYLEAGPVRTLDTLLHAIRDPLRAKLPRVQVPMLVIRGAWDPIVPQRWVEEMTRLLPRGQLAVLANGSHVSTWSDPDELFAVLRPFLAAAASHQGSPTGALRCG